MRYSLILCNLFDLLEKLTFGGMFIVVLRFVVLGFSTKEQEEGEILKLILATGFWCMPI